MTAVIEVTDLTKRYSDTLAVDGVSFAIEKDTIYGLLGRNGAGKTTVMSILTAQNFATSGDVQGVRPAPVREREGAAAHVLRAREPEVSGRRAPEARTRHGAAVLPELGPGSRRPARRRLPAADEAAHQEALARPALRGRRDHRTRLARRDHVLRRAVPRPRRGRPPDLLRPAARGLHRAPPHGDPLEPPHRRGRRTSSRRCS